MKLRAPLLLVVGLLIAADAKEDTKKDTEKIQGTWKAIKGEKNGKEAGPDDLKDMRLVFKDDKLTIQEGIGRNIEATFKLDAGAKLREIDITIKRDNESGTIKGLYMLDGDDLKICLPLGGPGKERPKEFATKEGSGLGILTLKRDK